MFEKYEKEALTELPRDRFEISIWKKLKVYRDIHIQFNNAYYSVPCEYRGEYVWARGTASQIAIFIDNKLIAAHFVTGKGQRSTTDKHYPPDKIRYMRWDTSYCEQKAENIGENTTIVLKKLLFEEPIRNLRSAQNILRLGDTHGAEKLERACTRAVFFKNYTYSGIKNIIIKNINESNPIAFEIPEIKLDSSLARNIQKILKGGI